MRAHPLRVKATGDLFHMVLPEGAVWVGRGCPGYKRSPFANPFTVKQHGLEAALDLYQVWLASDEQAGVRARLPELAGKRLACRCALDSPCHADILAGLANA